MRMTALLVIMLGVLAACRPAGPSTSADVAQDLAAIDRARSAYEEAWRSADAARIAGQYTAEAAVLYPNQPAVIGRAAITDYFRGFFEEFVQDSFALASAEVHVTGDWAFDRGTYLWSARPRAGGAAISDNGKYLVILRRQADGTWLVERDMDNSDRPLTQSARAAS